jgi:hypothetical protein
MANKRIYYAIQQVSIGDPAVEVHGLQSVGISTNFSLEQVFELGQLEIYQNVEEVPEVEVTLNKVLDGYPLIYSLATEQGTSVGTFVATSATLSGRQNARCDVQLGIYPDTGNSATGSASQTLFCAGMYVSSVSYTFPVDGNFTEDVTLVGNSKIWTGNTPLTGAFDTNNDSPAAASVGRRQFLDIPNCVFPTEIPGVQGDGTLLDNSGNGEGWSTHFQNITLSCDLGRESINELGRFAPYHRYVTFPVEVTAEFEVLTTEGDGINAAEEGYYGGTAQCDYRYNLVDNAILIKTCEGTTVNLGGKNKLSSINYSGGDTGGGNVTVTYSYVTYNDFTVSHTAGTY